MSDEPPVVFISYSHDSAEHAECVRGLAASLSRDGCDCRLDVHKNTDEDWPPWMSRQVIDSDFVLCVTTETYHRRFRDKELPDIGLGVGWEAGLIRRLLYKKKLHNDHIFPVAFNSSDREHIPLELEGYDYFDLDGPSGYETLLRKVHKRPLHAKPATGTPPDLPTLTTAPLFARPAGVAPPNRIASSKLPAGAEVLIGRDDELGLLDRALKETGTHVVEFVAWGGVGKSALAVDWMSRLAARDWPAVERYFDWSFYSQGTRDQSAVSADLFIAQALAFFGDTDPHAGSPHDRGGRLAELITRQPTLLILDGLEPLQYGSGPLLAGRWFSRRRWV